MGYFSFAIVGCGILLTFVGLLLLCFPDRLGNEFRFIFGLCSIASGVMVVLFTGSQFLLTYAVRNRWPHGLYEWIAVSLVLAAAIGPILVGVRILRGGRYTE